MSFPQTPRDIRVELFVNDGWTDVSDDVRRESAVTIGRIRKDEASKPQPSSCALALNNHSSDYSPRWPTGPYYGSLDRNTPIRVAVRTITDDFGTNVSGGWGSTDTGQAWTTTAGSGGTVQASDWNVSSGKATHSIPAATAYRMSHLATTSYRELDAAVTVSLAITDITGGAVQPANLVIRGQDTSDYYYVAVSITTAEAVTIGISHFDGTVVAAAVTVAGLTHTSSQALRVRVQAEGHTVRAKVWAASSAEPYDFNVTGHTEQIPDPGWLGIRSGVAASNSNSKPIVFSYDDYEVRVPRFAGEIADLRQRWDVSGTDVFAEVDAAGISRRLGQGQSALASPARRYIESIVTTGTSTDIVAWWPLEDGPDTLLGEKAIGAHWMEPQLTTANTVDWAASTDCPGAPQAVNISDGGRLSGVVDPTGLSTAWSVAWLEKCEPGAGSINRFHTTSGVFMIYTVHFTAGGVILYLTEDGDTTVTPQISVQVGPAGGWDEHEWHHFIVSCKQNGTSVDFTLYVDGVLAGSSTETTVTMAGLRQVLYGISAGLTDASSFSHVVVFEGTPASWPAGQALALATACLGHVGELAGDRIERLCSQEGVPFAYVGDLDDTPPMGAQAADTLLSLLESCADADQGTLYESRGVVGFVYRTRTSLYNQDVVLDLDYSGGQIDPPFESADDDQNTRNDVTVTRVGGSSARAVLESGRMSVLNPQDGGAGRYDTSVTVNVETDEQLPDLAGWLMHLGTVNETRYPVVRVNLANGTVVAAGLESAVLTVDADERVTISNPKSGQAVDQISQIVRGYTERLANFEHTVALNCAPESPYQVMVFDDGVSKWGSDTTTLNEDLDTTETGVDVAVTGVLWTTAAGQMPIEIVIGGERMSVTAISGASSPQTMTVTRSVNGVVKSHSSGAPVRLARRSTVAL